MEKGYKLSLKRMVGISKCRVEQKDPPGEEAAGGKSGKWKQRAWGRDGE